MAFTPINSSHAVNDGPDDPRTTGKDHIASASHNIATTVVSTYLGRGEATKKLTAKGRKRTSTANPPTKTKRRQVSIVDEGLSVSKPGDGKSIIQHHAFDPAISQASSVNLSETQFTATQSTSFAPPVSTALGELASTASKPISVHSSKTTMNALNTASVPTSVEIAKASDGQGFTLYQGPSSTASYSSSVSMSNPNVANERYASSVTNKRAAQGSGRAGTGSRRSARLKTLADVQSFTPQLEEFPQSSEGPLDFDDEGEENFGDIEIVDMAESHENEVEFRPNTPPNRGRKLNTRDVDELEDYGGSLLSDADRRALSRTTSQLFMVAGLN